MVTENH